MACACKVDAHIKKLQKQYGTSPTIKTNMRDNIKIIIKKILLFLACLPFIPLMVGYIIIRNFITNKPISISGLINIFKYVRNK